MARTGTWSNKGGSHRWLQSAVVVFVCFRFTALGEDLAGKIHSTRETLIQVSGEPEGNATRIFVENLQTANVTVTFEMQLVNLEPKVRFPYTTTLAGKTKLKVLSLSPKDPACAWSWTYTYYCTFGSTTVEHDDSCVYSLPFAPGNSFLISQGYNGAYSHFGPDQFAIDWRMPVGTPVHAARAGIVVGIKSDSDVGGNDSNYDWDANYILIQHPDGTLAQYVHLMKGGSKVALGQHVESGEWIGLSGNTGHSTGPHLHFSVFKAKDGQHRQTIPVRYQTADYFAAVLQEGRTYKAPGSLGNVATSKSDIAALTQSDHWVALAGTAPAAADLFSSRGGSAAGQ